MAYDALTTSGINNLVESFKVSEIGKKVTPLNTRKFAYQKIASAYSTLSSKLDALKSVLSDLKSSSSSSIYYAKKASSSNTSFVSVTSSSGSNDGTYSVRINQLAKNDVVLSSDLSTDAASSITAAGIYEFEIKTADGIGGEFNSKVSVTLSESDFTNGSISNNSLMKKIQAAVNTDKAIVKSNSVTGDLAVTGSFTIDLNGSETTINYSEGSYSDVIDSIVSQLNSISGIVAEKMVDGESYSLKVTVNDSSNYISFKDDSSTLLSELGISSDKEKAASGVITASVFTPSNGTSQISFTAKNSGYDYRILSTSDMGTDEILNSVGLNLGSSRQAFVQNEGLDTAGFLYSTNQLNAKFAFNGLNVERNSNTISDIIEGATIQLKSVMQESDGTVSISVNKDNDTIKTKVQDFITKFNDLYTYIKTNSKTSGTTKALFANDTISSSILSMLNSFTLSTVSGISSNQINSLTKIGITFNVDSGLSLSDNENFNNALENKLDEVISFFSSENGIATKIYDRIDPYLGSGGYIAKSKSNYDTSINSLSDSITAAQTRIDKNAESLRNRYIQMQMQLAQLLSYQNYFSSY